MTERVTFSFGENWQKYLDAMPAGALETTRAYVHDWLGDLHGKTLVDVGSGSGLLSLCAHELGAQVTSFDVDPESVAATGRLAQGRWEVRQSSILEDPSGNFDVVVSWGVLHHTGNVWRAIENAARLVKPDGVLWLALYTKTWQSGRSLRTKRLYNRTPALLKPAFRLAWAAKKVAKRTVTGRLRELSEPDDRGMVFWRNVEDWLGGLPYEPVSPGDVLAFLRPRGFELVRLQSALGEGGNDIYLFRR